MKHFDHPASFRQSLENRLLARSKELKVDLQRLRRRVAFERFLARLFADRPAPWVLKGGYALETRFAQARATKDLDLSTRWWPLPPEETRQRELLDALQSKASQNLNDFFVFQVRMLQKTIQANPYGGHRFSVRSSVAGRLFETFPLDIGFGDPNVGQTTELQGEDWLGFCGIAPAKFVVISLEQQLAEKLHALTYSSQQERENTRVKDLVDAITLFREGVDRQTLLRAIERTFRARNSHIIPRVLPKFPPSWIEVYGKLAAEVHLSDSLEEAEIELSKRWADLESDLKARHSKEFD